MMELVVTDTREAVVRHLRTTLGTLQIPASHGVTVRVEDGCVSRWDAPGVCYVNGGNTVGVMAGRLDTKLLELVPGCEPDVAQTIKTQGIRARDGTHHLPLFSALLSRSPQNSKWLLNSPCMYLPGHHSARGTRNAFHATHTALSMVVTANRAGMNIRRVVMAGMCTGHGRMNRLEAARQMMDAVRAVFVDKRLVEDGTQAQHPRLLCNPQYSVQDKCVDHEPFQPMVAYILADGSCEVREPEVVKTFRSGGSEEPSPFEK